MDDKQDQVFLDYKFLIDTGIWMTVYDFETWLGSALSVIGAEGHVINSVKGSVPYQRVVCIYKKSEPPVDPKPMAVVNTQANIKQQLKSLNAGKPR